MSATAIVPGRYLEVIEDEVAKFTSVARRVPLDAHLPAYPGYQTESLSIHIGGGLRRLGELLSTKVLPEVTAQVRPPSGEALFDWVDDGGRAFLELARSVDLSVEIPSYPTGELKPASAVLRTVATEVAIHRWDLESVSGTREPIAPDFAVDVIDSIFDFWAPVALAGRRVGLFLGGTVLLDTTDVGLQWLISVEDGSLVGRRVEAGTPSDARIVGTANEVLALLWKRVTPEVSPVSVEGDASLVARLLRIGYIPDPQTTAAH